VSCDVAVTVAPGITDPDLSVTVPEKLAVAWPYALGEMHSTAKHAIAIHKNSLLFIVDTPLRQFRNDEVMRRWRGVLPDSCSRTQNNDVRAIPC
ncbi:MAG: hypothetical protein ACRD52_00385, partial [Candidatus Acidiferrales bacterium]